MFFNMTTIFYCEKNCVANHKDDLIKFGKKALIVTGKHSSKLNGSLKDVTDALDSNETEYLVYDKIEENPSVECIMDAVESAKSFSPDYVIGIGGGSPLDASKSIALMLANTDKSHLLLTDKSMPHNEALPVVCVPTTCGTGSEVTPYSILTFHDKQTKSSIPHLIFPKLSLGDPTYLSYAPESVLKNTAVDALGHFIESYINTRSTKISRMLCEKGMSMWQGIYGCLVSSDRNYEDYENLLLAASFSGMAISHTSTSLPHGMSYFLTYEHGVPHGKAVGMFLAEYVRCADEKMKSEVLSLLGYKNCDELKNAIHTLVGEVYVTADEVERYTSSLMNNAKKLASTPFDTDINVVRQIISQSLSVR